ncbi:MAG: SDR family NAD(P)-dependent oxidoreductase, partial [Chloroflexota bacterium]|nr:SDR family NAD(P)-dependent oxidoreductase [Chloroflexota bacterium]
METTTSDKRLAGKVAIVTGAGSPMGLGRAMTLALVGAGARVAIMGLDQHALDRAAAEAREVGGPDCVLAVAGDVSRPEDARRAVERTIAELGGLHVLVNNAGTNARKLGFTRSEDAPFWELPAEAWFRVAAVNYVGPALLAGAAVKHMLDQQWGRIIGITTSLSTMYLKGNPSYGSSKAGHEAFM